MGNRKNGIAKLRQDEGALCQGVSAAWLHFVNTTLIFLGIIIVAVGSVAKQGSYVSQLSIIAGVITMGVFLILLSILGIFSVATKRTVALFVYILLMVLLFVVHFSVSVAVLSINKGQEYQVCKSAWCNMEEWQQRNIQNHFICYGFSNETINGVQDGIACDNVPDAPKACYTDNNENGCEGCYPHLADQIYTMRKRAGGVSLAFCFFELVAIVVAAHYRKLSKMEWAKKKGYTNEIL